MEQVNKNIKKDKKSKSEDIFYNEEYQKKLYNISKEKNHVTKSIGELEAMESE